jgi:copper resistance protein B
MSRLILMGLFPLALAGPVAAQTVDHSSMPGMTMPAAPTEETAKPKAAGHPHHDMAPVSAAARPATPATGDADPHAGHDMPGMDMGAPAEAGPTIGDLEVPPGSPPPPPSGHAADQVFPPATMAAARDQLRREHGGASSSMVMANIAEWAPRSGKDSYRWEGEARFGGDIHRLALKSEGEGVVGGSLDHVELQALYSRAVGPYFNLQAGVRHDFQPRPARTYATVGFEGLAPYWFEVSGAAFLSDKGDLSGRLEGSYDQRITQRLILQPRAEFNLAASNDASTGVGSGLSDVELGLRLRYEIRREFAPYIGVTYDRKFGKTADYARAVGEDVEDTRLVLGVRAWF